MICLVTPVQRDQVLWQLTDQIGLVKDDVAPELHRTTATLHRVVNLQQKLQVYAFLAAALAFGFALPQAKVKRFVAADVEHAARKVRKQLVEQRLNQFQAARIQRIKR